jgi:hypothetical protein
MSARQVPLAPASADVRVQDLSPPGLALASRAALQPFGLVAVRLRTATARWAAKAPQPQEPQEEPKDKQEWQRA